MNTVDDLLTVRDVARLCQVHEVTIRRHIASGQLRSVHVGRGVRLRREDVDAYLEPEPPAPKQAAVRHKGQPLAADDPFVKLVGRFSDRESASVSGDKYGALAEAYADRP